MISGVTIEVGGAAETLRMTTRAMMAAEDKIGSGLIEIVQGLEKDFRVGTVVRLLAECGDDGRGVEIERAQAIVDEIGFDKAGEALMKAVEAAFPEAKSQAKNAKRAGRSK